MIKRKILTNTLYLFIGNILAKILVFILYIYLAKSWGPAVYGEYLTAIEFVMLVAIFANLGFDMTMLREGAKNIDLHSDLQLYVFPIRIGWAIIITLLSYIFVYFVNYPSDIKLYIYQLLPLIVIGGLVTSGFVEHFLTYFRIIEKMIYVSIFNILRVSLMILFFLIALSISENINIEIFINIIIFSSFFSLIYIIFILRKLDYKKLINFKINIDFVKTIYKPVFLFGIVSIMYLITTKIDIQMLSVMTNTKEVGMYGVAWQIVNIGIVFISSFALSLFPTSAKNADKHQYRKKLFKYITIVSTVLAIIILLLRSFFNDIIVLIYGKSYIESADILFILAWFIPLRLFGLWGTQILESLDKLKERVVIFFFPFILNIVLNYYLIPLYSAKGAAIASVISILLTAILSNVGAYYILKRDKL